VKIGRRLVLVLLVAMTPVIAVYTYWSAQWSRKNYIADLKRETTSTTRALAQVVAGYIERGQWRQVHEMLTRMSADGTDGAVLQEHGELWYAVSDLPPSLIARAAHGPANPEGFDFEQSVADHYWFCRVVPLDNGRVGGRLLVAQDWTDIDDDVRQRMLPPVGAALLVTALVAALIPILVSRYISKPLAKLSRRVSRFSGGEEPGKPLNDEVEFLSEEFQRLDARLTKALADLLERHRYELELDRRLQRADRLATIGTLASGLAHEIGTPMGVIRTRAELLLENNCSPAKAREGLEIIVGQIERLSRIVRMLLDYAHSREPRRAQHDVRSIIEHVLKLVETEAKRCGVRVMVEMSESPLMTDCDAEQLQQVFINLAMNAFDAMAPRGGKLRVCADVEPPDNGSGMVRLVFEDTGTGVPAQYQDRLFDPFFTTKPPGKGTGMGLSVSQAIVHDHSGEIGFESGTGGTRFFVRLPMHTAEALPDSGQDTERAA
jgi:two-component system NtrC family sensor kinase